MFLKCLGWGNKWSLMFQALGRKWSHNCSGAVSVFIPAIIIYKYTNPAQRHAWLLQAKVVAPPIIRIMPPHNLEDSDSGEHETIKHYKAISCIRRRGLNMAIDGPWAGSRDEAVFSPFFSHWVPKVSAMLMISTLKVKHSLNKSTWVQHNRLGLLCLSWSAEKYGFHPSHYQLHRVEQRSSHREENLIKKTGRT